MNIIIKPTLAITSLKNSLCLLEGSSYTDFSNFYLLSEFCSIITNHCINNHPHNGLCHEA